MKKLENIPKKEIFTVPEGYFDKLPAQIQNRVTARTSTRGFTFVSVLKFALPVFLILLMAAILFYNSNKGIEVSAESMLAAINTEDLVAYLDDSELSTDDVLETIEFNDVDLNEIEESIYELNMDDESFENFINEID